MNGTASRVWAKRPDGKTRLNSASDSIILSDDVLRDLEQRLSDPLFLDMPIGATLTDFLAINFLGGHLKTSRRAALTALFGWWRFLLFGPRRGGRPVRLERNRLLLTWSSDTPRFNDLLEPVIAELDPNQCNVAGRATSISSRLDKAIGYCTADQVMNIGIDRAVWRREYRRCRPAWHRHLWQWLQVHCLPRALFPHLAGALAARSWQLMAFGRLLEDCTPTVVLTDAEHNNPWACLVLAARRRGIPTATMMHGVIYSSYGYAPLLSEVAFCWGRDQVQQMIALGVEPDCLRITGCQRLVNESRVASGDIRPVWNCPRKRPS